MTIKEQMLQEMESASEALLEETLNFMRFLKTKKDYTEPRPNITSDHPSTTGVDSSSFESQNLKEEAAPIIRGSKAEDLLKFAGTWQGDDFEECLQLVYETRSQAKF